MLGLGENFTFLRFYVFTFLRFYVFTFLRLNFPPKIRNFSESNSLNFPPKILDMTGGGGGGAGADMLITVVPLHWGFQSSTKKPDFVANQTCKLWCR